MSRRLLPATLATALLLALGASAAAQHEEKAAKRVEAAWSRRITIVQARRFDRQGALELAIGLAVVPNDALRVYLPLGIRLTYHATSAWGVELSFAYALAFERDVWSVARDAAWREEKQRLRAAADLIWSPFYGKLSAGFSVVAIEPYLALGAGIVQTEAVEPNVIPSAVRPEFNLAVGLRLGFGRRWLLRFEARQHLRVRPDGKGPAAGGLGWPLELGLWGGVLLGGGGS